MDKDDEFRPGRLWQVARGAVVFTNDSDIWTSGYLDWDDVVISLGRSAWRIQVLTRLGKGFITPPNFVKVLEEGDTVY